METKTYTTLDRVALKWPSGPWNGEPDKVQWPDAATGLPCLAVRHARGGYWCGYVGVPEGHPWYECPCGDLPVTVHDGLSYAAKGQPDADESRGICHVPAPGEPDHVWWFGFACGSANDRSPREEYYAQTIGYPFTVNEGETYKPLAFVQAECAKLAAQLKDARKESARATTST